MHQIIHGPEIRDLVLENDAPGFAFIEPGSMQYRNYNSLIEKDDDTARSIGIKAVRKTVWSPRYPILDIEVGEWEDMDAYDNATILNILKRKNEIILDYDRTFQDELPRIYEQLHGRLEQAVREGHAPSDVLDRWPALTSQTKWVVSDGMENTLGSTTSAYKNAVINSDLFVRENSQQLFAQDECVKQVVAHEMTHRLAGMWGLRDGDEILPYRQGISVPTTNWLDEFTVEKIADYLIGESWGASNSQNPSYTRVDERAAGDILLRAIPLDTLSAYYFAEADGGVSKKELHRVFREKLNVTYPKFMRATADPKTRIAYLRELITQKR